MIMTEFWKTKKFSDLSKVWDKKLSDSGFVDIEIEIAGEKVIKQDSRYCFRNKNKNTVFMESKIKYYQLVSDAANWDYEMSLRDKIIMINHSDGMKQADIIKELEKEGLKCRRETITKVITRYLTKWKIPTLKPRKTK